MAYSRRSGLVVLACIFLTCLPAASGPQGAAAPEASAPKVLLFEQDYDFEALVDGKPAPDAAVYKSRSMPGMLVSSAALGGSYFTRMSDKKIVPVDMTNAVKEGAEIVLDPAASFREPVTGWQLAGSGAEFSIGGKTVRVQPRPPVLGKVTTSEVLEKSPLYRELMSRYEPDPDAVSFLKRYERPVEFEVFFGSWCHVCKQYLPQFLRTIRDCSNPKFNVTMFGLPREFTEEQICKDKQVNGVPLIIVYEGGKELGRIEGPPTRSYEKDIGGLLRLSTPSPKS